ncbi:hypothetical protein HYFRA_00008168 [Hymenoscyphus fraxineus]|uniref:Fungal N-terminal domain-containing protein n=1 Tax=Hymenoscyphus fraxineus TaxID=746836 RepID=A0A9N9L6N8_9HELO|nr:hypothetical protein HYFRA_00008168 [Hymenoscyphus fraxineus]
MAEVIGAVASGMSIAAFAGQIASSVLKLKSYIDQVKDAPEDIKIMVEEIEDLQLLLSDIEDDQARYPHSEILAGSKSLSRCLNNCKRGVDRLQRLVDEISLDFKSAKSLRHKTVSMKFIWKKDKLVRYRAELAATVSYTSSARNHHITDGPISSNE